MTYKIKIKLDEQTIFHAKVDKFEKIQPIFNELKKKFGDSKRK